MDNQQVSYDDLFPVPNMNGYFVSKDGQIWSFRQTNSKKLGQYLHYGKSKKPYYRIKIAGKLQLAHRVCCSAFLQTPIEDIESVNHLDGDTLNNKYGNLEISNHMNQVIHATKSGLYCSGDAWYKARGLTRNR